MRAPADWILGFAFSCLLGHFVVEWFYRWRTRRLNLSPPIPTTTRTSPSLTGFLERVFFTTAVAMEATGVLPAMMTWLVLKLAANWQYRNDVDDEATKTNRKFRAILTGLLSMLIAYIGGLLIIHRVASAALSNLF